MRRFTIAFRRTPNPSFHSHAPPPSLPSRAEAGEVGALQTHAEIPISVVERSNQRNKAHRKSKANAAGAKVTVAAVKPTELSGIGGFKAKNVIVHEEETASQNAATATETFVLEEEKALQNAATEDRAEKVAFHATANENILIAKKELLECIAKLDLRTFKCGCRWEKTAYKLLDFGISSAHVMKMLPKCRSLGCAHSPDPMLKQFEMLGMSHEQMGRAISIWPKLLNNSDTVFQSKVEFFESVGIDKGSLGRYMHVAFRVMALSLSTLKSRYDIWKDCFQDGQGKKFHTSMSASPKAVLSHLSLSFIGLARLHYLLASGFTFDQLQKLMANCSRLLLYREAYINVRLSYAVNVMNLSFDTLAAHPQFWTYSFEKRIKYRHEVLQELKTLGAYEKNISLGYMLKMTDANFYRRFVRRFEAYTKHSNI